MANQALENMAKPGAADEVTDLPGYTLVSSVEELKAALADDSIDKMAVTRSLTFDVNDNISVGAGKTLRGVDDTVTLSFETNQKGLTAITLADDAVIRDISVNHVSKYVNEDETGESGEAWHSAVTITGGIWMALYMLAVADGE